MYKLKLEFKCESCEYTFIVKTKRFSFIDAVIIIIQNKIFS